MLFESDSHVLFWDFEDVWRKSQKGGKLENLGKNGLLRRSVGSPRRGIDLHQGVGYPHRGEVEVPKWYPSGTSRCSYYSQQAIFGLLFRKSSFRTLMV